MLLDGFIYFSTFQLENPSLHSNSNTQRSCSEEVRYGGWVEGSESLKIYIRPTRETIDRVSRYMASGGDATAEAELLMHVKSVHQIYLTSDAAEEPSCRPLEVAACGRRRRRRQRRRRRAQLRVGVRVVFSGDVASAWRPPRGLPSGGFKIKKPKSTVAHAHESLGCSKAGHLAFRLV